MAQRPTNDFDIDPNITSGTDLANILNRFQDAMDSGNSGASRPAYLAAGGMWVKEGDPMRLYLYDGTKDIELYNTTDGIVGAIEDGTVDGQITTWNAASGEWTPEGAVVVDGGNVLVGGISSPASSVPDFSQVVASGSKGSSFDLQVGSELWGRFICDDRYPQVTFASSKVDQSISFNTTNSTNGSGERMRIDANGNVGIGTDNPSSGVFSSYSNLVIGETTGSNSGISFKASSTGASALFFADADFNRSGQIQYSHSVDTFVFVTNNAAAMTIDANGRVGIGGEPGTRNAGEYLEQAKTQIASWKAEVKKRTAEQPEASTQEITLEVTDGDFGVVPTAEALAEKLAERAIGGGDALLQVSGDGHFSGAVNADLGVFSRASGLNGTTKAIVYAISHAGANGDAKTFRAQDSNGNDTFYAAVGGNGYFSGTVDAGGQWIGSSGRSALAFSSGSVYPGTWAGGAPAGSNGSVDLGTTSYEWKDGYFSGTVYANGSPLTRATDLIETLSTLREATRDETTLEGLRDALSDAIGGLIQKFEAQVSTTDS